MKVEQQWYKNLRQNMEENENFNCAFYKSAKEIINNYILKIGSLEVKLTEIEFYYFDCENHNDTYVHLNKLQKESGRLYVHEKADNRAGIDLTFGSRNDFGGILIRGIDHEGIYISGPVKVREYIAEKFRIQLESYNEKSEAKKLQKHFDKIQDSIYLKENKYGIKKTASQIKLLHSTRVGLSEADQFYKKSLYRFVELNYLNAKPENFYKKKKIAPESTRVKAISSLTEICKDYDNFKSVRDDKETIKKDFEETVQNFVSACDMK